MLMLAMEVLQPIDITLCSTLKESKNQILWDLLAPMSDTGKSPHCCLQDVKKEMEYEKQTYDL